MRTAGPALPARARQHHTVALEAVLPEAVARLLDDAARAGLSVTLDQALHAGHDPHALLRKAVDERELSTVDDVAGVLIWRLRRVGNLPTTIPHRRCPTPSRTTTANTAQTPATENERLEMRRHPTRR
ncbi:hypothetical protein [Embleya sp. MST-111070]|uniref:hypothetical protein n=1 Tax=Embleya sp. MST-111070 TaxID=3398231 RepID=UPI003F7341ED